MYNICPFLTISEGKLAAPAATAEYKAACCASKFVESSSDTAEDIEEAFTDCELAVETREEVTVDGLVTDTCWMADVPTCKSYTINI